MGLIILLRVFPRRGITYVWLNNSVAIKNGSKEGTTEFAHSNKPDVALFKLVLENKIINKINKQKMLGKMAFLSFTIKNFIKSPN